MEKVHKLNNSELTVFLHTRFELSCYVPSSHRGWCQWRILAMPCVTWIFIITWLCGENLTSCEGCYDANSSYPIYHWWQRRASCRPVTVGCLILLHFISLPTLLNFLCFACHFIIITFSIVNGRQYPISCVSFFKQNHRTRTKDYQNSF